MKRQSEGEVAEKLAATPDGESVLYEDVAFSDVTPNPNLYVHAIPDDLQERNGRTHMAFLTDLIGETTDLSGIYYRYRKRWSSEVFFRQTKHGIMSNTESADGTVVFDRSSGDVATEIDASPSVATDDVLVSVAFQEMVAYNIASGSERWRTDSGFSRWPVADGGRLVGIEVTPGPQSGGSLVALDLDSGDEVWAEEIADLETPVSSVAVTDGVATFMSRPSTDPGTLYAHDFADGTQLWSQGVGTVPISSFSLATDSGIVIAPGVTDDNRVQVRAYDAQNGEQLDATSGGLGITEAAAVDRVFLEIDLADVTATEF